MRKVPVPKLLPAGERLVLGCTVEDSITGFRGVVTGRVQYITGCNQSLVAPRVTGEGSMRESQWFDDSRLRVDLSAGIALVAPSSGIGPDRSAPKR